MSGKGAIRVAHMQAACIECLEWQFSFPSTTSETQPPFICLKLFLSEPVIYNEKIFTLNRRWYSNYQITWNRNSMKEKNPDGPNDI